MSYREDEASYSYPANNNSQFDNQFYQPESTGAAQQPVYSNTRGSAFVPEAPPFAAQVDPNLQDNYRQQSYPAPHPAAPAYPVEASSSSRYPARGEHYRTNSAGFVTNQQREYSDYPPPQQQAYPPSSTNYEPRSGYTDQPSVYPQASSSSAYPPSNTNYPPSGNTYPAAYPQQQIPPPVASQNYQSPSHSSAPFSVAGGYYPQSQSYPQQQPPSLKIKLPAMANDANGHGRSLRGSNTIVIPNQATSSSTGRVTRGSMRGPPPPSAPPTPVLPTHGRNTRSADPSLQHARAAAVATASTSTRPVRATRLRGSTAPAVSPPVRKSSRNSGGGGNGGHGRRGQQSASDFGSDSDVGDDEDEEDEDELPVAPQRPVRAGRKSAVMSYRDPTSDDGFEEEQPAPAPMKVDSPEGEVDADGEADIDALPQIPVSAKDMFRDDNVEVVARTNGASKTEEDDDDELAPLGSKPAGRSKARAVVESEEDEDGQPSTRRQQPVRKVRKRTISPNWDEEEEDDEFYNPTRNRNTRNPRNTRATRSSARNTNASNRKSSHGGGGRNNNKNGRTTRSSARGSRAEKDDEENYSDKGSSGSNSALSPDNDGRTSSDVDSDPNFEQDDDIEVDSHGEEDDVIESESGRPYSFRQRKKVINYAIPPPLEDIRPAKPKFGGRLGGGGGGGRPGYGPNNARAGPSKGKGLGWSASGADLDRWMGGNANPADSSDSDYARGPPTQGLGAEIGAALAGGSGMAAGMAAAAGAPVDFGKVGKAALADADPLGVNTNVTFDEVGGLDDHIHQLKEMTLLPLLYPEVFQRFNVTPPRGVLFHGPPGTGKTLLARALAASCRTDGKEITFFMRKGADCLSKWVGEAERQLRLLFDEARACQPSIIFFDEIDGLAPVRSSKQDQIHASIVSTLLALMDGMDGRGQVVVIGATNRPDSVDPALRRPGRFDREFYFPLPGLEAREKILGIMTKGWDGWGQDPGAQENVKGLAKLTKGYGGADLRALCTEAALNAVQRRYPQIYQSNERLLLKPETIGVGLRDFMISVKKLVPSSARSSSSAAAPLPLQFAPLLTNALDRVKQVVAKVLPMDKKRTALEEAQFEEDCEEGALKREMDMQSMETLRVYRPRMILHGAVGMGQSYVGAAALHHLEGYHVQSLELGTLMSDSTRSVEAAIVQLFVEAKRHQPSVIYIPSLVGWCAAVTETSRSTVRAMLETLAPTDPILLLAIVDGSFMSLPRDVRAWFGSSRENRVELLLPTSFEREAFFAPLLKDVEKPPNEFADGVKRRKRALEVLPVAPPLEPRQPTEAELALQDENDQRTVTLLKYRLEPILTTLKRKFKRFTKRAMVEYNFDEDEPPIEVVAPVVAIAQVQAILPDGTIEIMDEEVAVNGDVLPVIAPEQQEPPPPPPPPPAPRPRLFDMDLERIHTEIFKGKYLTPQEFLDDVGKIMHNARIRAEEDQDRMWKAHAMFTAAQVSIQELDPTLKADCDRMAPRERKRRDDYRAAKKDKAREAQEAAAAALPPGPRRSGRNNGQEPEIPFTDPSKLERTLKRQRSAGDSPVSDAGNGTDRSAKRAKIAAAEGGAHVRFADGEGSGSAVRNSMVVDPATTAPSTLGPAPASGFDAFLLNPLPPAEPAYVEAALNGMNGVESVASTSQLPIEAPPAAPAMSVASPAVPSPKQTSPAAASPAEGAVPEQTSAESAMVIDRPASPFEPERSPTPHPDFHVDSTLLAHLTDDLRSNTNGLTVEQLEQLRATCLARIWRQRTEWDRDPLVEELRKLVSEFVDEIKADEGDEDVA